MKVNHLPIEVSVKDFSLAETLECGQCFRYEKIDTNTYTVIAAGKQLYIRQASNDSVFFYAPKEDLDTLWLDYFDLKRDYSALKNHLSQDSVLAKAIQFAPGLHLLRQEFFECLISFIFSQNNHIPRIKKMIETVSRTFGTKINDNCYAFPNPAQLSDVTEETFRNLGTGFRAKYLVDAVAKINNGTVSEQAFSNLTTPQLREYLMQINGVGPKVADCIMLFSLGRYEVFPIDVWVRRIMSDCYCNSKETSLKMITALADEKFGAYAGFAQQYLFHYARQNKIGKSKE